MSTKCQASITRPGTTRGSQCPYKAKYEDFCGIHHKAKSVIRYKPDLLAVQKDEPKIRLTFVLKEDPPKKTSKKPETRQKKNGDQAEDAAKTFLTETLGYQVLSEVKPAENKQKKTTADLIVMKDKKKYTVSVKSKGGAFTSHNLGTGFLAIQKWLGDDDLRQLERLKKVIDEVNQRKQRVEERFDTTRWQDLGKARLDIEKSYVMQPFLDFYLSLWEEYDYAFYFLSYLQERTSDLLLIMDDNGEVFRFVDQRKMKVAMIPEDLPKVYRLNSKSIVIGDYEVRFKSEGGKISSSIKMNVQPFKPE